MAQEHHHLGGRLAKPAFVGGIVAALLVSSCSGGSSPVSPVSGGDYTKPISFAILEDYDKGSDLRQVARDFKLFQELGVPAWRGSFGWDDYEPEAGRFDLDWLERFVALADTMEIELHPYLGYTPAWAGQRGKDDHAWNDPPRRMNDWTRFVDTLARRLGSHRSVASYEIYNEENTRLWWEGTSARYAQVLRAASDAIRQVAPGRKVLLGGMVWPDADWLEASCTEAVAPFDVLPFHAYPETWTPDSVTVENYLDPGFRADFLRQADEQCGRKPIWINEAGFATTPGKTEEQQAEWWVRAFATFLAEPRVEHIGIYEIRDQQQGTAVIGDTPNYYLGLIRADGKPKLAFETVKMLVELFGRDSITVADSELRVRVSKGRPGKLYQHLFRRPDGRQLVFVWDRLGNPTVDLELAAAGSRVTLYGLAGERSPWTETDGRKIRGVPLRPGEVRIFAVDPVTLKL
jgi:polysaccharide biosynthesis protein PslG